MLPILQINIPMYALFATIGLVCATIYTYFRIDKVELSFKEYLIDLAASIIGLLIGARLMFVIAMLPQIKITLSNIVYYLVNGGIVFYGGMLGMILGVYMFSKVFHKNFIMIIDVMAPAIPMFHFFARIGCLFAGCCYGIPWKWGVIMQDSPNVVRFPVQVCESLCNAAICIVITVRESRRKSSEGNIKIYLILYAICRFVLEFFRGDSVRGIWLAGLSTAQIVSLIIVCIVSIFAIRKKMMTSRMEK